MHFKYSGEHRIFIENNYKGITSTELTEIFNKKFKTNLTRSQIKGYLQNHKLKNGVVKRFEKGHIPANKGTKGISKSNKTSFKKGNIPKNYKPVGSERITRDGYIEIKTAAPNIWEQKHKILYEKEYGKIPENHVFLFLDQNKQNLDLDNLVLITKQERLIINKEFKLSGNKDINETKILIAKIKAKCSESLKIKTL